MNSDAESEMERREAAKVLRLKIAKLSYLIKELGIRAEKVWEKRGEKLQKRSWKECFFAESLRMKVPGVKQECKRIEEKAERDQDVL